MDSYVKNIFLKVLIYNIACGFYLTKNIQKCQITVYCLGNKYTYKGEKDGKFENITNLENLKNAIQNAAEEYKINGDNKGYGLPMKIKPRNFKIYSVKKSGTDVDIDINNVGNRDLIDVYIREVVNIRRGAIVLLINGTRVESNEILDFYGSDLYEYLSCSNINDSNNDDKLKWFSGFLKIIGTLYDIEGDLSKCNIKNIFDSDNISFFTTPSDEFPFGESFKIEHFRMPAISKLVKGKSITIELEGEGIIVKDNKENNERVTGPINTGNDNSSSTKKCCC